LNHPLQGAFQSGEQTQKQRKEPKLAGKQPETPFDSSATPLDVGAEMFLAY
jgi:hypothetical protein